MNTLTPIPVITGKLAGQSVPLVDARLLHAALESSQDFSTWIKRRIQKYGFEVDVDYLLHQTVEQVPHQGGLRTAAREDYSLTLDMAKELAMVERTPRGRQARRYFIACEQQLRQLQSAASVMATPVALSRAQRQAINRQAWADVSSEAHGMFQHRRETLIQQHASTDRRDPMPPLRYHRPLWEQ